MACSLPRPSTVSSAQTAESMSLTSMAARHALLLPGDPDRSARELHRELKERTALNIPILITDSFGRPWREGLADFCIGIAGMKRCVTTVATAIRMAISCRPVSKLSPTNWPAPPLWSAANSTAPRPASFADSPISQLAAALAICSGPQLTTCFAEPSPNRSV